LKSKGYRRIGASQRPPLQDPALWEHLDNVGVVAALARRRLIQEEAKMRLIILIILIILVVGALPSWPYSTGWGYYPVGGLGTLLIIILILALLGYV
jgi:Protein of unknown function (DUF3309)